MHKVSSFYHNYDRHKIFWSIYFFLVAEIDVGYTSLLSIGGGILIHQVIRLVTG